MGTAWKTVRLLSLSIVALSLVVNSLSVYGTYLNFGAGGSDAWIYLSLIPRLFYVLSFGIMFLSSIAFIPTPTRRFAAILIAASLSYIVPAKLLFLLADHVKIIQLENVASNGQSLVNALHSYIAEHRQIPDSLEVLVPKYISEVPTTGLWRDPQFRYATTSDSTYASTVDTGFHIPAKLFGNPWMIWVKMPVEALSGDILAYYPDTKLPKVHYERAPYMIGDWSYVPDGI